MDWLKLLSDERLGVTKSQKQKHDGRSQFQKDFDRIVFSPAFRRLQDKTQVFPLPESDFVHTRLTHSLEVAVVGRSLGNLVGDTIVKRHPILNAAITRFHFGDIVAAACLAHDIGNPPFGHSGEDAIAEFFKSGYGKVFKSNIKDLKKWNDLIQFEGNAQGFRIITRLQNPNVPGGLRLTFATLAAFTKYPRESFSKSDDKKLISKKAFKKFGFFQSEKDFFKQVAEATGLLSVKKKNDYWWVRHPLSFLVEAADDICYRIMDLEDGFRLGLISFREAEELLIPLVRKRNLKEYSAKDEKEKIGYLRAKAISELVNELASAFLDQEKNILNGNFENDLITIIKKGKDLQTIKDVSFEKIYRYRSVVEREAAGYEVLGGLLETFISAHNEFYSGRLSPKNRKIIDLLPKKMINKSELNNRDIYERMLSILDFISGMTDSFAVSLYRKIKGISLPGGRITE